MSGDARWTRRDFLSTTALGAMGLAGERRTVSVDERFAYVGTYTTDGRSQGIYRLWLNAETGALRLDGVAAKSANPSYLALHPNGRVLYAVNELSEFRGEPSGRERVCDRTSDRCVDAAPPATVAREGAVLCLGRSYRARRAGGQLRR